MRTGPKRQSRCKEGEPCQVGTFRSPIWCQAQGHVCKGRSWSDADTGSAMLRRPGGRGAFELGVDPFAVVDGDRTAGVETATGRDAHRVRRLSTQILRPEPVAGIPAQCDDE